MSWLSSMLRLRPFPLSLVGWCASWNNNNNDDDDDDDDDNKDTVTKTWFLLVIYDVLVIPLDWP